VDDGVGPAGTLAWATPTPPNSKVKAVKDTPIVLRIELRSEELNRSMATGERSADQVL
jgi:hypothetical protein